jgi:putative ABC transport system permease protein
MSAATRPAGAGVPMGVRGARSRLRRRDAVGLGMLGLRMRRIRSVLSALGISIGIAAIVGVTGISGSSRADLMDQLDRLGTNLLTVEPGKALGGDAAVLSPDALGMVRRIPLVDVAAGVAKVGGTTVRRSPYISAFESGGIAVRAADPDLLRAVDGRIRSGTFLNRATASYPVVVLGAFAAARLGITSVGDGRQVWIDGQPFVVLGILEPIPLVPELDRAALVGWTIAASRFGFDGRPTILYVRADEEQVATVRSILGRTADPAHPAEVLVSRPSDALAARAAANDTFTYLLIALGLVALLVAAVGIVNVMLIAVLERRAEIGLRRALGATRMHVATQFLGEAVLLAGIGGVAGCAFGGALTLGFAYANAWRVDLPAWLFAAGIGAAMLVGTVSGLYPALRASRLPPMEALRAG